MKRSFILLSLLFLGILSAKAQQVCKGAHSNEFVLKVSQGGADLYYRINHCTQGDEVLLRFNNNNNYPVNITFTPKISSANQQWNAPVPVTITVPAQSNVSGQACSAGTGDLQFQGHLLFENEYYPQQNSLPMILDLDLLNVSVNP